MLFALTASAQFQFFEQMFGNQGQQQGAPQNVRSDSTWYKQQYENGRLPTGFKLQSLIIFD